MRVWHGMVIDLKMRFIKPIGVKRGVGEGYKGGGYVLRWNE